MAYREKIISREKSVRKNDDDDNHRDDDDVKHVCACVVMEPFFIQEKVLVWERGEAKFEQKGCW